jgi:hypothetical protein
MSDSTRLSFRIEPRNIPDNLRDVTLPVEVFGPDDRRDWVAVPLHDHSSTIVMVNQAGKHDLRIELPSGVSMRLVVHVSSGSAEPETIHLDLGVRGRREGGSAGGAPPPPEPMAISKRVPEHALAGTTPDFTVLRGGAWLDSRAPLIECAGLLFEGWKASPVDAPEDLRLSTQSVSRSFSVPLGRETRLEEHPGWSADTRKGRPLLLHVRHPILSSEDSIVGALVLLPPAARFPRVNFVFDPDPHPDPAAPRLLAYVESVRPAADALFTYIRAGSFEAARHAQATVKQQAEELLYGKEASPVCAMVAAYALYRLGDRERVNWVGHLADWFDFMPDGAVVYGSHMLLEAKPDAAWKYFKIALDRGVPMYSEGLKLLCDGLVLLRSVLSGNPEVHAYAARAFILAGLANMDSELTCLRLDSHLQIASL